MIDAPVQQRRADLQNHWEEVYTRKGPAEVSWHQEEPRLSLALIAKADPLHSARILDVGGGTSLLVDRLLDHGYETIAVLDISSQSLDQSRARLGERAGRVRWLVGDITQVETLSEFDVWHDRAVFHFLTREADRRKYVSLAERTVPAGGHLIMATFALDGPDQCSGLDVCRYDAGSLAATLGPSFTLVESLDETHRTPWGAPQHFVYCHFRRAE